MDKYEARVRRLAPKARLFLKKCREKGERAGTYELTNVHGRTIFARDQYGFGMTLEEAEQKIRENSPKPFGYMWQ
jgi:hypothetical protein